MLFINTDDYDRGIAISIISYRAIAEAAMGIITRIVFKTGSEKIIMILFILVACVGCDQSTKYTAKHFLEGKRQLSYLADSVRLCYAENSGAFLSLGADLPETARSILFVFAAALLLAGFLLFIIWSKEIQTLGAASGALIIGGGLSNLIDRILNDGVVIDFMNLGMGEIRTGIFNVADMAIMSGIVLFVVSSVIKPLTQSKTTDG